MAQTYRSRQLRLERDLIERFGREHTELARIIARIIFTYAVTRDGRLIIPNTRQLRDTIRAAIWLQVLRPYYIGWGDDPFIGTEPQSPFANLIYDGVIGGIALAAEQQASIVQRLLSNVPDVLRYVTGERPILLPPVQPPSLRGWYDTFHRFVDQSGYTLSDKIWRDAVDVRSRINRLLEYHIGRGTAAVDIAQELENFLTPGAAVMFTNTPYGREGSFAARRLARTEITAAAGRSTVNASIANPFVSGVKWTLSLSHPCCDICDTYATGGKAGDGVYLPEELPMYPAHPHEMCNLQPQVTTGRAAVIDMIRQDMRGDRRLQGLFNERFLQAALVNGFLNETVGAAVNEMAVSYAA